MYAYWIRWLAALGLLLFGLVPSGFSQSRGSVNATAATDTLSGTRYIMTTDTDDQDNAKTTFFRFNSNSHNVVSFNMKVTWDSLKVQLTSFDETNYFRNFIGFVDSTVNQGANYIKLTYVLDGAQPLGASSDLVQFNWSTPCQADGSTNLLSINPSDQDNVFVVGSTPWAPSAATSGSASIYTYAGDIWTKNALGPIGTNIKVPLWVVNNFNPIGGMYATISFDTAKLAYQSYDTIGTLSEGQGEIAITRVGGTLTVQDAAAYSQTDSTTWMYLVFRNRMSDTGTSTTITVREWEQRDDCSLAKAEDTTDQSSTVSTPKYLADLYWQDNVSMHKDATAEVQIQLLHNFYINMDLTNNASRTAFRVDANEWTKLKGNQTTVLDSVISGGKRYFWERRGQTGSDVYIFQEHDGHESDSIPPYSTRTFIAKLRIVSDTLLGTQAVNFVAEDSVGFGYYQEDSKVTAKSPGYTLHSTTNQSDSLFRLHGNTVSITSGGGGGGSCPFVYTWDGSEYALEDVVLTESEKQPERTPVVDYLPLTFTPAAVDGTYRLRIHEQEAEKTFLDYVELIAVDHAPGYSLSVTQEGKLSFGSGRIAPTGAVDDQGRNVLDLVGNPDDRRVERVGSGYIVATYEGRPGISYALTADDSTGQESGDWKNPCKVWAGPQGQQPPELSRLRLEVEDARGDWHELPATPMRLPLARVRPVVDLSAYDLPGTFRIRYNWDERCNIDQLSLVQQVSVPHTDRRLPVKSVSHSGADPGSALVRRADGQYAELVTGEYLDLTFPADQVPDGKERSFVLVTKGYYLSWYGHPDAGRPLEFGLNGNYPNPFNPSTTIRYSLAADGIVSLEIFNILGQKVRTLVDERSLAAGAYEAFWDGNNEQGRPVGSGAYLYRLTARDLTDTRRMILLK